MVIFLAFARLVYFLNPDLWKICSIKSILKSRTSFHVTNYRPISVLSHIYKMFGSLMLDYILTFDGQNRFCPGWLITSWNANFCKYIFDSFHIGSQVDVIAVNFENAFDSVNYDSLISIISTSGFSKPLLSWIHSCWSKIPHWVKLFGIKSIIYTNSSQVSLKRVNSFFWFLHFL